MYTQFFGLRESPFSIAPDPRYLYMSERHREGLAHLLYGVCSQGGFVLLTGEVGTGKTTVCQCFLQQIPDNTDIAFIIHPKLTGRELLAVICDELRIPYDRHASVKALVDLINQHLLQSHARGRNTLVIIDEAQNLSIEVLEQLRLLTNLETTEKKLLQVVLLGQPELNEMLARPELRQLSQRITARYHLQALSREDVRAYVNYRLSVAGLKREVFTPGALTALYRLSQGIPRLINLICDRALLGAYARHVQVVDRATLKQAAREVLGEQNMRSAWMPPSWLLKGVAAGLILGVVMAGSLAWLRSTGVASDTVAHRQQPLIPAQAGTASAGEAAADPGGDTLAGSGGAASSEDSAAAVSRQTPLGPAIDSTASAGVSTGGLAEAVSMPAFRGGEANETISPLAAAPAAEDRELFLDAVRNLPPGSEAQAFRTVLQRWGVEYDARMRIAPCAQAEKFGLRCLQRSGNWRSLLRLDRPAVLQLRDAQGAVFHLALLGVSPDGRAWIGLGDRTMITSLQVLDEFWAGNYTLLWRLPPSRVETIRANGQGTDAQWLATRLGRIESLRNEGDAQEIGLSLEQRLKRFQLGMGLVPDGIAGAHTLIHMSTLLDQDVPRLTRTEMAASPDQAGHQDGQGALMEEKN